LRKSYKKRERHSRDSLKSLKKYLRGLSRKRSKLLVIRLDFGYRSDPQVSPMGPRIAPSVLHEHRQQIVDFFQKTFAETELGYIIKTEFGLFKGPHLHAVFILDGNKVRRDISIGTTLGEHWQHVVTSGQGIFFNCNRIKSTYLSVGIGLRDYRNPKDWEGAERMIEYITKVDFIVRVWAAGDRTLVKGWMPRPCETARGRPRTKN
jgi:hypothetical protein